MPSGRVATYGDVAREAGRPRAARAVGRVVATAARPGLPYHRVVAAGGAVGGYGGSIELKIAMLRAEGVIVVGRRLRGFSALRWTFRPRSHTCRC